MSNTTKAVGSIENIAMVIALVVLLVAVGVYSARPVEQPEVKETTGENVVEGKVERIGRLEYGNSTRFCLKVEGNETIFTGWGYNIPALAITKEGDRVRIKKGVENRGAFWIDEFKITGGHTDPEKRE